MKIHCDNCSIGPDGFFFNVDLAACHSGVPLAGIYMEKSWIPANYMPE